MSGDGCEKLDGILRAISLNGPEDWRDRLDALEGVEGCIRDGLARSSDEEDWLSFERYVVAASRHPDRSMTPILCEVLSRQIEMVNNEDIVEVLAAIADRVAVECLERTLWWEPPWDEFRNLAIKCVSALAAIGTSEAVNVLRDAARSDMAEVREAAAQKLDQLDA